MEALPLRRRGSVTPCSPHTFARPFCAGWREARCSSSTFLYQETTSKLEPTFIIPLCLGENAPSNLDYLLSVLFPTKVTFTCSFIATSCVAIHFTIAPLKAFLAGIFIALKRFSAICHVNTDLWSCLHHLPTELLPSCISLWCVRRTSEPRSAALIARRIFLHRFGARSVNSIAARRICRATKVASFGANLLWSAF